MRDTPDICLFRNTAYFNYLELCFNLSQIPRPEIYKDLQACNSKEVLKLFADSIGHKTKEALHLISQIPEPKPKSKLMKLFTFIMQPITGSDNNLHNALGLSLIAALLLIVALIYININL